jgi:hypothetical protein
MTTTHLSRAAHVAEIHGSAINASRTRCGLEPVDAATLAREFADLDRLPARAKAVAPRTTSRDGAVDAMWGGIVTRLNSTLAGRVPIVAARPWPGASGVVGRFDAAVDWGSIASALNTEAGLKTPVRTNAR